MTRSTARSTPEPPPEPIFYGWRYVKKLRPDGTLDHEEVPLTLEDVLHPQEGDVIPEANLQHIDSEYLGPIFRERAQLLPGGLALVDCLVDWGVPGNAGHSPDVSVFQGVTNPPVGNFGTFHLRASGGRCVLALEIVSPNTRSIDVVEKFREYHQVRVPLYVLIDQVSVNAPRHVVGYRYTPARYVRMRLDRQGRLLLKPLGLLLGVEEQHAVCYDAATGERLGDYAALDQARRAAERQSRAAEQRIRELEAELRRLRGERPAD
jgi:Uma2 family endonuclease